MKDNNDTIPKKSTDKTHSYNGFAFNVTVRGLKVDASLSCDDRITVDRLLVGLVMVM